MELVPSKRQVQQPEVFEKNITLDYKTHHYSKSSKNLTDS